MKYNEPTGYSGYNGCPGSVGLLPAPEQFAAELRDGTQKTASAVTSCIFRAFCGDRLFR